METCGIEPRSSPEREIGSGWKKTCRSSALCRLLDHGGAEIDARDRKRHAQRTTGSSDPQPQPGVPAPASAGLTSNARLQAPRAVELEVEHPVVGLRGIADQSTPRRGQCSFGGEAAGALSQ